MRKKLLQTLLLALFPAFAFLPAGALLAPDGRLDAGRVPWILLLTQIQLACWLALLLWWWKPCRSELGWLAPERRHVRFALAAGLLLALSYELALSPALDWLRQNVGDVVPPGETRRALGSAVLPFVIANVLLAPLVEEGLFRALLDWRFRALWGERAAAAIGIASFGLLHWAGGVFYVAATALVGAGFLALRRRTGSLAPGVAAHLSFNSLEVLLSLLRG